MRSVRSLVGSPILGTPQWIKRPPSDAGSFARRSFVGERPRARRYDFNLLAPVLALVLVFALVLVLVLVLAQIRASSALQSSEGESQSETTTLQSSGGESPEQSPKPVSVIQAHNLKRKQQT